LDFKRERKKVNEEVIAIPFVDPTKAPIGDSKKKKFEWELNKVYQNPWVTRFFFNFVLVCERDGKMRIITCMVCSKIEGKKKLLIPRLDLFFFNQTFRVEEV